MREGEATCLEDALAGVPCLLILSAKVSFPPTVGQTRLVRAAECRINEAVSIFFFRFDMKDNAFSVSGT